MKGKRQLHDGIAGALITAGVALGYYVNPLWLLLPGILGVTLLQSGFTGFCPVYFILDRTCPERITAGDPRLPEEAHRIPGAANSQPFSQASIS